MNDDPSKSSFYITDAYYQRLVEDFADWQRDEREVQDLALRDAVRRLLNKEARLLEGRAYDAWLALYAPEERVGPMIVSETTGLPYRQGNFGVTWREIADAAGVPKDVWNMDSRSGGLTEADEAGADPHDIQRHATHSDPKTTGRYIRRNLAANERVAELRVASRRKDDK